MVHKSMGAKTAAVLLVAVFLLMTGPAWAADEILPINPVPNPLSGGRPGVNFKPVDYHGEGLIERIDSNSIVILDSLKPLAYNVTYRSGTTGLDVSKSRFVPGVNVGYRLNPEKEVVSLWLLEP
jgi:hypothetical protein